MSAQRKLEDYSKPWRDPRILEYLYHERELTMKEVGERLGCSEGCVYNWMDRYDIPRRDQSDWSIPPGTDEWRRFNPVYLETDTHGYEIISNTFEGRRDRFSHHRLLAVCKFGFDDVCDSLVHHENRIPWDNREENLKLFDGNKEHRRYHIENY